MAGGNGPVKNHFVRHSKLMVTEWRIAIRIWSAGKFCTDHDEIVNNRK